MIIPKWLAVYGDINYRGECPTEHADQIAFFSKIRNDYPETYGKIALHPNNDQRIKGKGFYKLNIDKAKGFCKSASDIIIPGCPTFVCELKRQDHTKSKWQDGQIEYLETAKSLGAFVCVALGVEGAIKAFEEWTRYDK